MNANEAVKLMLTVISKDNAARQKRLETLPPAQKSYTQAQIDTTEKLAAELTDLVARHSGGITEGDLKLLFAKWKMAAMALLPKAYDGEKTAHLGSRPHLGALHSYVAVGAGLERLLSVDAPAPKETLPA